MGGIVVRRTGLGPHLSRRQAEPKAAALAPRAGAPKPPNCGGTKSRAHEGRTTCPWGFGSKSVFLFHAEGQGGAGAARVRNAPKRGTSPFPCPPRALSWSETTVVVLGLPGEQAPRGKRLRAGPRRSSHRQASECAPAPPWLREDLTISSPPRFPSLNYGPGRIPPGLERNYPDPRNMPKWK